ncbi:helix-turn-helix domain-containing protein [Puia sp.]|jgi:DNA-binding HxlR family transcriptional regulator|uniref:winged helix-turn-helix transcriptional regulator n=1 Tax=Puia sp. TaxID=2045100 RepID=UPI002F3F9EFE
MEKQQKAKRYHDATQCPMTATIDVIGGKWKPIIIFILMDGPLRFGEIHRTIPGMALKVLSRQLKELEEDDILIRTAYPEVPPRVEYSLSPKGETLRPAIQLLSAWGTEHLLQPA